MDENELKKFEEKEIDRITQKVVSVIKESKTLTNAQVNKIIDEESKDDSFYKGLEDWHIHYSKERIKEGVLNNKLLNQGKGELPLMWFNFYVYFNCPAGIVASVLLLFSDLFLYSYPRGFMSFLNLINLIMAGALFWGLKKRKLWGWKFNFVFLTLGTFALPLQRASNVTEFIIYFLAFALIWLLPNWIYFKKRKYLFLYSYGVENK